VRAEGSRPHREPFVSPPITHTHPPDGPNAGNTLPRHATRAGHRRPSIGEPTRSTGVDGTYLTFPVSLAYADQSTSVVLVAVGLETGGPKVCDHYDWRK
jgi:hypothetical protein